ncbi:GNAT family N-acetyltransferase [Haloarchaeobius iranensis]|uniref:Acetyltransferase (GNAT) domain-containing protein n=1 Tax=Haloarchaeobius iranensis TaxID=996166 RepID=A0A1G9ZST2_9EURY|nr:GNAT family N-acetyltransferase [Haloarchaeobius iranensis]SDN24165.1 Acetyltransferase (GNAT) domain-containing protein [Haloarchaeobius iranensis]
MDIDRRADVTYRRATPEDYDDVVAFTSDTWADRDGSDYIPDIYHDWIEDEAAYDEQFTCVAAVDGTVVSIAQTVLLSDREAWCQGMRTHPDYRGVGIGLELTHEMWDWAREQGATVARNMVFSWNVMGLGHSRGVGFDPETEFRWLEPEPDPDATGPLEVTDDPNAAWTYWTDCDARDHLRGVGLAMDESWAVVELTPTLFERAAEETMLAAVTSGAGTRGVTYRVRDYEREDDEGETEHFAEYGVGAWEDIDAARTLVAAIQRDAAALGADSVRVLIPETVDYVSDGSLLRSGISDEPDFVMAADLTADYRGTHG